MLYVKVTDDNSIDEFPYDPIRLKADNPSISFPKARDMTTELISQYNVLPVTVEQEPEHNPETHKAVYSEEPVLVDGEWTLTVNVVELDEEEISGKNLAIIEDNKFRRLSSIQDTDWYVVRETETGIPVPDNVTAYRQQLRDLTTHANWPLLNEEDWPVLTE